MKNNIAKVFAKFKCAIGKHEIVWGLNPKTETEARIWMRMRITDVGECKRCGKRVCSYT
jgi:hypothetical protein